MSVQFAEIGKSKIAAKRESIRLSRHLLHLPTHSSLELTSMPMWRRRSTLAAISVVSDGKHCRITLRGKTAIAMACSAEGPGLDCKRLPVSSAARKSAVLCVFPYQRQDSISTRPGDFLRCYYTLVPPRAVLHTL